MYEIVFMYSTIQIHLFINLEETSFALICFTIAQAFSFVLYHLQSRNLFSQHILSKQSIEYVIITVICFDLKLQVQKIFSVVMMISGLIKTCNYSDIIWICLK